MNDRKLFLAFWNLCLDNLPVGSFVHRRVAPDEARLCVEQARKEGRLLCVSHDDLLAPYRKRERKNHEDPCRVLTEHYGIALSESDFLSEAESGGDPLYSIIPLNCIHVCDDDKLLVVTCNFILGEKKTDEPLPFEIEQTSVEFHLIESV